MFWRWFVICSSSHRESWFVDERDLWFRRLYIHCITSTTWFLCSSSLCHYCLSLVSTLRRKSSFVFVGPWFPSWVGLWSALGQPPTSVMIRDNLQLHHATAGNKNIWIHKTGVCFWRTRNSSIENKELSILNTSRENTSHLSDSSLEIQRRWKNVW